VVKEIWGQSGTAEVEVTSVKVAGRRYGDWIREPTTAGAPAPGGSGRRARRRGCRRSAAECGWMVAASGAS
jgi:hypothetical protein